MFLKMSSVKLFGNLAEVDGVDVRAPSSGAVRRSSHVQGLRENLQEKKSGKRTADLKPLAGSKFARMRVQSR